MQCGRLAVVENGHYKFVGEAPAYMMFSIAELNCNDGYEMNGKDYARVCRPDGSWSGEEIQCVKEDCDFDDGMFHVLLGS